LRAVEDPSKPLALTNISVCGAQDSMSTTSPAAVTAQVMAGLALGASAFRAYHYDSSDWQAARAAGQDAQIGAGPPGFRAGHGRWAALSAAYNLIGQLEPDLLQPMASAVDAGPGFLTGARAGTESRTLIVVRDSDVAGTANIDLTPYESGGY